MNCILAQKIFQNPFYDLAFSFLEWQLLSLQSTRDAFIGSLDHVSLNFEIDFQIPNRCADNSAVVQKFTAHRCRIESQSSWLFGCSAERVSAKISHPAVLILDARRACDRWDASSFGCVSFVVGYFPGFFSVNCSCLIPVVSHSILQICKVSPQGIHTFGHALLWNSLYLLSITAVFLLGYDLATLLFSHCDSKNMSGVIMIEDPNTGNPNMENPNSRKIQNHTKIALVTPQCWPAHLIRNLVDPKENHFFSQFWTNRDPPEPQYFSETVFLTKIVLERFW